jgi:2-dehydropantoate 2-reductase
MRGNIGQVVSSPGGHEFGEKLLDECFAVLKANGLDLRTTFVESNKARLKDAGSTLAASMLRDMESGSQVEADQIIGDLIKRAESTQVETPYLKIAYCNLKVYELKRIESLAKSQLAPTSSIK